MVDKTYQQFLQGKADEIQKYLATLDFRCTYKLIDNGINFTVYLAERTAGITLYHSPKRERWKFYSVDEWANTEIKPKIESLLGQRPTAIQSNVHSSTATISPDKYEQTRTDATSYFEEAIECFRILQTFSDEYIDFSVICEQARIGIKRILDDPSYTHLDQAALQTMLAVLPSPDFATAKEYLFQCLTLCHIPTHL
jgi:hypothetical protein